LQSAKTLTYYLFQPMPPAIIIKAKTINIKKFIIFSCEGLF